MINELTTVTIHGKTCHIYKSENNEKDHRLPVFYWGVGESGRESTETVVSYLKEHMPKAGFLLAAYESENWNDDFSPWKAAAAFGKADFGGKAEDTLKWLTEQYIPYIETDASEIARFPVGYSLAGLFSLWVYCECDIFTGAVSCSGSLWYEGWIDYVKEKSAAVHKDKTNYVYLSLGSKEEKTKNKRMSTVGDSTREVYAVLCEEQENVKGILEWNQGGHFSEPDLRIAKGIYWILKHFVV